MGRAPHVVKVSPGAGRKAAVTISTNMAGRGTDIILGGNAEFMARADDYYLSHPGDIKLTERKLESGEKFLNRLPSEYFETNIRFSSQPMCFPKDPAHFKALMAVCKGEDWLLYSSDWPHATFDPLNWVFNALVSEDGRKKILRENARGWIRRLG